ncbi:hypothetical protein [Methylobacterium sp. E-046]|uniref:hypothetical protein n=1 Tax=Methylobacterium sp. E-046 TaxID=2836576 RepID=UPI001FBB23F2|nr:hypothetical protein [Methylobacterium sp. E-046]MCJ2098617.1 hypothetical protein [Methylobacterium sp. E-046]
MVRAELDGWARDFAADHGCEDVTVPFDRVVLRHLPRIEVFLTRGLTFTVLAHAITRAGVQRKDGRAYSDKQLNTAVRRARYQASMTSPSPLPRSPPVAAPRATTEVVSRRLRDRAAATPTPRPTIQSTSDLTQPSPDRTAPPVADPDKELSSEDIRAALQRIRRADP